MDISESTIRNLRKKAKSWLASLTYYSAQDKVNVDTFSRRLQSLLEPELKPDILKETVKDALPETIEPKEAAGIKKRIMSRLTPNKVYRRLLNYPQIPSKKVLSKDKSDSFTLGRLLVAWAVLTDQSPQDFIVRVSLNVTRLYKEWCDSTGCRGLSDEECRRFSKESARFWSGIWRTLIRSTPEENLIRFMHVGINALGAVIGMPGLEKELCKLLGQASRFITKDAVQKIELAFKANPIARERIDIPELKALVLSEEDKLGWSSNTEKEAVKTLRDSLSPELKEAVNNKNEVIISTVKSIGRRGLFNNLLDALNGQLRPRFVESIKCILKSIAGIKSHWEFSDSRSTTDNNRGILEWLFRRC